ncbi:serine/threonine-protein kinase [Anaeromyxobacter oryzae]|uniref:Protein kinase domain-containing protein n=1 Tax=Anaeromyxobacter oryzae TaxID=2918170 RepID=A0ABM7WQI2_9BACT|nr:serine/threonine-protein kinase [Anaeromyxobacter oryzae]BDG01721.1 hypothetical protein AMOR_07170 [Anaeromyxobacter oryzae]
MRTFGRYRLLELLASGGMADVWRAETTGAAGVVKEVALKLVRGEHEARSDFVRMFIEEARLASRLTHANVVQVFDFDQVDGRYFIAMELVRGRTLAAVAERARELGQKLGLPRAVHVGAEVAKGLAYAHRLPGPDGAPLGIVHRDVSPHNVLVSFEGEVKLADFGIARAMSRAGLTEPGTVKGKLAYMPPEQARGGGAVDSRADVFALGVVLWELCAGRRLFARDTEAATYAAVVDGAPPSPPSAWNEAVPPELDGVVLGALERDPARRTASAQELANALGRVLLGLVRSPEDFELRGLMHRLWPDGATPAPARAVERTVVRPRAAPGTPGGAMGAAADEVPAEETGGDGLTRTAAPGTRRRRRWAAIAALAVSVVVGVGGLLSITRSNPNPNANPPPVPGSRAPGPVDPGPTATTAGAGTESGAGATGDGTRVTVTERPGTSTGTATGTSTATLATPAPTPVSTPPVIHPAPVKAAPAPSDATSPGLLHVTSPSWAYVSVDGRPVGETPMTIPLPPGRYRVRASHPRHGMREAWVEIAPGRRTDWAAGLGR